MLELALVGTNPISQLFFVAALIVALVAFLQYAMSTDETIDSVSMDDIDEESQP